MHIKHSEGYGISHEKFEYEELAEAARKKGLSIREILDTLDDKGV